ncbi:unnamed protein product [Knipowitschia caucasica]
MATVPCSKCTAERKGFRRELDSWKHKLIHCIGFESILEGIYGPLLLRDLSLFDDFEPEEVIDWSPEENGLHCSFCNLPLEKLNDHVLSSTSPLSSPSDYSPHHVPALSESSQSAHRFLQAVFSKKDVPIDCDPNIPLIAQELMKKMIRQFAMEYASKCPLHTTSNGVQTKTSSPQSEAAETTDAPLDLTVSRAQEEKEPQPDGVLDLSKGTSANLPPSKPSVSAANHKGSGRQQRQKECIERSLELSEGLLSKALKDIRSGRLQEQRAALLYGIPLQVLKQGQESLSEKGLQEHLLHGNRDVREEVSSYCVMSSMLGGEARLVLQKVAAWAERAEIGGAAEENGDLSFPLPSLTFFQPNKTMPQSFPQLRDALQAPSSPTSSLEPPVPLRIPQVRSVSDQSMTLPNENGSAVESLRRTSLIEGTVSVLSSAARPLFKLRPPALASSSSPSPHRLVARTSLVDYMEEGADRREKDKQPRKKRGRYRQYDHELMEEAITMVMAGRMSVSKAQGVYGVPHSTLEYKIKERTGTLKNPPKKKNAIPSPSTTNTSGSNCSANSGILTSAAPTNRF